MFFNKEEYENLFYSLNKKFFLYSFITEEYIKEILDELMLNGSYKSIQITDNLSTNPLFDISFKIQTYIYLEICKLCENDVDVLLSLVEDKRRIVNLVLRKLKVDDNSKLDDYIMECTTLYNGKESFDSFLTRYVMSSIRGVPFIIENKIDNTKEEEKKEEVNTKKNKKKKKKQKNINVVTENKVIEVNRESYYDQCFNKCISFKGSAIKDEFINWVLLSDLVNFVQNYDDEKYKIYFLMRYGLMNDSYYSREEIAMVMQLPLVDIINYERKTINDLKTYINNSFMEYEKNTFLSR